MKFLLRHKLTIVFLIVVGLYYVRFVKRPDGMTLYPLGAKCLLRGEPLEVGAPGFTYPPFFAFSMIPFAPMPMWLRNLAWYAVLVGATWGSFRLCEQLTLQTAHPLQGKDLLWLRVFTCVLSLKVALAVFENQAFDTIVFLFVLLGLYGLVNRKDLYAAVGFALAAALKVTPLLFFPYLLLRGRVKLLFMCVALYTGFSFLPDLFFTPKGASSGYFFTWARDVAGGAFVKQAGEQQFRHWDEANPLNQSLRSLVFHLTSGSAYAAHSKAILYAVCLGFLMVMCTLMLRSARMKIPFVLDGSILLISMLMLSPMSSKSHFVVLMLPYMVLSAYVIKECRYRWLGGSILAMSFALITLTSRDVLGKQLSALCLSAGCVTLGTLVLLVFFSYVIFQNEKHSLPDIKQPQLQ